MFCTHQPPIGQFAQENADHFAATAAFVIATARQPLDRAVNGFQAWWHHGDLAAFWAWKPDAVNEMWRHRHARFERIMALHDRDEMLLEISNWTGFGLEKGGFLLQLAFGISGCLDTHNKTRLAIPENKFKSSRLKQLKSVDRKLALIREYHDTIDRCGGTAVLWDEWCVYIFERSPRKWNDSDQVSQWHALAFEVEPSAGQDDDVPF